MKPPTFEFEQLKSQANRSQAEILIKQLTPKILSVVHEILGNNSELFWLRNMSIKPNYMPEGEDFTRNEKETLMWALRLIHSPASTYADTAFPAATIMQESIKNLANLHAIINSARYKEFRCHHALIT